MAKQRYTAQQVANALTETKGMTTIAAQRLGCDYNTVTAYIKRYDLCRIAQQTAYEQMGDAAELKLYQQAVNEGNTTALIFLLKTRFKQRGYVEKILIEGNIQIELVNQVVKAAEDAGIDASQLFTDLLNEIASEKSSTKAPDSDGEYVQRGNTR